MMEKIKSILKRYYKGGIDLLVRCIMIFPSLHVRMLLWRLLFRLKAEKRVVIHSNVYMRKIKNISIGYGTVVGHGTELDGRKGLKIGKNVNFSSDVKIYTLQHDYNSPDFAAVGGAVEIGDYAWISANAIILPNVRIGKGAVVAAGAVVTKDVEDYTVVGGIPARKISSRIKNLNYQPSKIRLGFV